MATHCLSLDRARTALELRIRRRHATVTRPLQIGPLMFSFTRVAHPDDVLVDMETQAADGGNPLWQPYWAAAWESAHAIAGLLAQTDLTGTRVLDLGCGLGLTGTVAAARGASVLMADAAQPALLFARLNAWPWRQRVRVRRLDWRHDRLAGERFSLIIGADILYEREDWPSLERFWRAHLEPNGRLLLGEPSRGISQGFSPWLTARGWHVQSRQVTEGPRRIKVLEGTWAPLGPATQRPSAPEDRDSTQPHVGPA